MRSAADLAVLEAIAAGEAQRDFWAFRRFMDPQMMIGWWQENCARHLQQFADDLEAGKRPKLLISAPPQHGKSETIVDFIAWLSGRMPDLKTIYASFSERLGVRANMALQRKFELDRFQRAFPALRLSSANVVTQSTGASLRNREILEFVGRRGFFRNTTVGGAVTGESLDLAVLDDPIKGREEANSQTVRDKVWSWLTDDFMTRFSSRAGLLCILTRWHVDDPAARLLAADPTVKVLTYPAIAEANDGRSKIDRARRNVGEALFPELKPLEFLEAMKRQMDPGSWESLYQQRPTVAGGNLFRIDDFQCHRHAESRPYQRRIICADTAMKTTERADWSVFQAWGLGADGILYLIDQARGKYEAPELEGVARAFWQKHKAADPETAGYLTSFCIEDKSSGTGLVQQLQRGARGQPGLPIKAIQRSRDKVSRAYDCIGSIGAGNVSLPGDAPFSKDLLAEIAAFPNGTHDDQIDPMMDAISELLLGSGYDWNGFDAMANVMAGGAHADRAYWQARMFGGI